MPRPNDENGLIPQKPQIAGNKAAHLLLPNLRITSGAPLSFQSLDPPFKRVAECASIRNKVFQLRGVSLGGAVVGGINGSRVEFRNARNVVVELFQAALYGGDLERVEKPGISVGGLFGLGGYR